MRDFKGKVAVVTGGASGVGLCLATQLAEAGARVVIADVVAPAIDAACAGLAAKCLTVEGFVTDVTRAESVEALAEHVFAKYGTVHLLFNNAGVGVKEASRPL